MIIEAILAGFLGLGLPPAAPGEIKKCDYTSSAVGCSTNHGGGGNSPAASNHGSRDGKGGKGKK